MSFKRSATQKGVFLLVLLIILFLLIIVQPVNKLEKNYHIYSSTKSISDSNIIFDLWPVNVPNRLSHSHKAFSERIDERLEMVYKDIQGRDINDPYVLRAMGIVPRHFFVRASERNLAYIDSALPIEYDQTISQPYVVAFMTQALELDPNSKVLEIGTGSGYQAAVCGEIAKEVYTVEIVEGLAKIATERLRELGYSNVFVKSGDGYFGWPEHAPYDAIIGTAAAGRVPEPLIEQLKPAGRMIIPVENELGYQELEIITKDKDGKIQKESVLSVQFVPMTGEIQKSEGAKTQ